MFFGWVSGPRKHPGPAPLCRPDRGTTALLSRNAKFGGKSAHLAKNIFGTQVRSCDVWVQAQGFAVRVTGLRGALFTNWGG